MRVNLVKQDLEINITAIGFLTLRNPGDLNMSDSTQAPINDLPQIKTHTGSMV